MKFYINFLLDYYRYQGLHPGRQIFIPLAKTYRLFCSSILFLNYYLNPSDHLDVLFPCHCFFLLTFFSSFFFFLHIHSIITLISFLMKSWARTNSAILTLLNIAHIHTIFLPHCQPQRVLWWSSFLNCYEGEISTHKYIDCAQPYSQS